MAETRILKRLNSAVRPLRYVLNLAIDPDLAEFSASCEIEITCDMPQAAIELHALGLIYDSVQLLTPEMPPKSGKMEVMEQGMVSVSFDHPLPAGSNHLRFAYHAPFAKGLEGLYRARNGLSWGAFTQFQALGARRVFPCFDEPAFKAVFVVTLRIPDDCEAFANEVEVHRSERDNIRTVRFAPTQPISTYLVAFAVGKFDVVEHDDIPSGSISRAPIPLRGIARHGQGGNFAKALEWTAPILQALEAYFGMAYPFSKLDIVAVPDFAAGGMENAGLICYEEGLILIDEDSNFQQYRDVLTTHAHEIAHHWVGNLVSPAWWDDLWLNESFATFMEAKISHQLQPGWGYDTDLQENAVDAMELDLLPSVSRIHRSIITQDEITAAFDAITYDKGAVALAMLETEMGAKPFQAAVQKLLQENRFGTYDTTKFFKLFAVRAIPHSEGKSFARLISETGLPEKTETSFVIRDNASASYFRAKFTPRQWAQVFAAARHLGKTEALRAVISLDLALQSRELTLPEYLEGVKAFAAHPAWQVAGFPLNRLSFLISETPSHVSVKEMAAELYSPLLRTLGTTPLEDDSEFNDWQIITQREDLAQFFAASDADATIELDLLYSGLRLLDQPDEIFEAEWYPDEMRQSALTAVIRTRRDDIVDILVGVLRETDTAWQREELLDVLALDASPGAGTRMRALLDSEDIKSEEISTYLASRAGVPSLRDDLLEFLSSSAPAMLQRLGGDADIGIISFADAFTAERHAWRLEDIIRPILPTIQGGEPQLKLTLERILLNAKLLRHLGRHV